MIVDVSATVAAFFRRTVYQSFRRRQQRLPKCQQ